MKKFLLFGCFLFVSFIGISQNIMSYTNLFDSLFVNISKRDATTGILYDRVSPISDATSFNSLIVTDEQGSLYHQKFVIK